MRTIYLLLIWFAMVVGLTFADALNPSPAPTGLSLSLTIPLGLYFLDRYWRYSPFAGVRRLDADTAVVLQTYRAPERLIFVVEAIAGRVDSQFAMPAGIGGILIGISAPWISRSLAQRASYSGKLTVIWNIFGLMDLVTAVILGLALAPTAISHYPLSLISAWLVPLSFILHFRSLQSIAGNHGGAAPNCKSCYNRSG